MSSLLARAKADTVGAPCNGATCGGNTGITGVAGTTGVAGEGVGVVGSVVVVLGVVVVGVVVVMLVVWLGADVVVVGSGSVVCIEGNTVTAGVTEFVSTPITGTGLETCITVAGSTLTCLSPKRKLFPLWR